MKNKIFLIFGILSVLFINNSYSQWTQINGFSKGKVTAIHTFGYLGDMTYAATYDEGFYSGSGSSWFLKSYYPDYHFYSLCTNPFWEQYIIAGTDRGIITSYLAGIFWDTTNLTSDSVYCLISDTLIYRMYAGTNRDLYYSINGGGFWTATSLNKSVTGIEIKDSTVIAAANDNIYVSSNLGINWTASDFQQKAFTLSILNDKIFAGAPYGVYVSANNGLNWTATSLHNNNVYKWDIGKARNNLIAYSTNGIYVSTDEGITWSQRSTYNPCNSFYFSNHSGGFAYITSDKGKMFSSSDYGLNWNIQNLNNADVNAFSYKPGMLFASIDGLNYSTNFGVNWSFFPEFQNKEVTAIASNNNITLAAYNGIISRTTNNGLNWVSTNFNAPWIQSINFKGTTDTVFAGVGSLHGARKSVDGGNNWEILSLNAFNVVDFAFFKDKIFAATVYDGHPERPYGVFMSTDQGVTWHRTELDSVNVNATSIAIAGSRIFVSTWNLLYYSDNGGINWNSKSISLYTLGNILVLDSLNILVGTFGDGIYLTTNAGLTWNRKNEGFINNYNYISKFIKADNYIFCGTNYGGLWKRPISDFVGINNEHEIIPVNYSLGQNYPNPFNSSTIIKYEVSKATHIKIKLYDVSGREILTLFQGYKTPGKYQISFSGENLSSGVYFYRFDSKTYSETKKMILIK